MSVAVRLNRSLCGHVVTQLDTQISIMTNRRAVAMTTWQERHWPGQPVAEGSAVRAGCPTRELWQVMPRRCGLRRFNTVRAATQCRRTIAWLLATPDPFWVHARRHAMHPHALA
jgi:hypothetical protein